MARDPRYDVLFEPIQLGPKTMRNRFAQVPHCHGVDGSDRPGFEAGFRGMKAEGGWAAVFTEATSISPDSDLEVRHTHMWDEGDMRNLGAMADAVHEHDSLAGIELAHSGPFAGNPETRAGGRGASQISGVFPSGVGSTPRSLSTREIREMQRDHVAAFKRARTAGFDLLTLYVAHCSTYPCFFLLPVYNRRTDEYGGSFENRIRFTREVLEMIREEIDDCAIGVRFHIDTLEVPYGLGDRGVRATGEGRAFIELLDPLVDYWDLITGSLNWGENAASSRFFQPNHEGVYTRIAKEVTAKPIINVGRFTDPDLMVEVINSGQCDIIGAARPSIADPFLPTKIEEGRFDDIRECIGCNVCVSRWQSTSGPIWCTQNATSGEEYRRGWHPERFSRAANADNDVLVLGAGPAGMECARVLGERQMRRVHLVDAEPELGGHLTWVTTMPGLATWKRVISYREAQLGKLANVQHIPGQRLSIADVLDYGAEYVVIATGSHWSPEGLNGITFDTIQGAGPGLSHVLTPDQVIRDQQPVGDRVVIYDTDGYYMAASVAEVLGQQGKQVTYVTPLAKFAPYMTYTLEEQRQRQALQRLGVQIIAEHVLLEVTPEHAQVAHAWSGEGRALECDTVVLATQRISNCEIYDDLLDRPEDREEAGIKGLFVVGDAHTPGMIAQSVFSGHRLAREIDSSNPTVPLPYIRERRLVDPREDDYSLDGAAIGPGTAEPEARLA